MAAITGTNLTTPLANGYVTADGFIGAPSTADVNNQRLSTQPALFPNGIGTTTSTAAASFTGGLTVGGAQIEQVTVVAAAGASQGTATAIPATAVLVNVTVTASTEGVKLPTPATGRVITLLTPTSKGYKVYAGAAGVVINAATTATTAFAMSTNKPATFYAVDTTHWRASKSA